MRLTPGVTIIPRKQRLTPCGVRAEIFSGCRGLRSRSPLGFAARCSPPRLARSFAMLSKTLRLTTILAAGAVAWLLDAGTAQQAWAQRPAYVTSQYDLFYNYYVDGGCEMASRRAALRFAASGPAVRRPHVCDVPAAAAARISLPSPPYLPPSHQLGPAHQYYSRSLVVIGAARLARDLPRRRCDFPPSMHIPPQARKDCYDSSNHGSCLAAGCRLGGRARQTRAEAGYPDACCAYHNATLWYPWHGNYYDPAWGGSPVALVVPPTATLQTKYSWGVTNTDVVRIYHQFGRRHPRRLRRRARIHPHATAAGQHRSVRRVLRPWTLVTVVLLSWGKLTVYVSAR